MATNHRGKAVGVWLGVAFMASLVPALALTILVWSLASGATTGGRRLLWILAGCLIVFAAGMYDDFRPARTRGIRRQVGALLAGRVEPGVVKLMAILLAAVVVAWSLGERGGRLVLGTPVIAGAANLWNLLDVVPGRALKYFLPAIAVVGVLADGREYEALAVAAAATGVGALALDLRERAMLGDTGSNVLGFLVGVGLLHTLSAVGLATALAVIVILHAASETVTLSRVIEAAPPLRWFDRLGRVRGPDRR